MIRLPLRLSIVLLFCVPTLAQTRPAPTSAPATEPARFDGYTLENNGGGFGTCASAAAVADAVRKLQDDPPEPAHELSPPSPPTDGSADPGD